MITRQAEPADAPELVRLRAVLLRTRPDVEWNDDWREPARRSLETRLSESGTLAAFVVDRPDGINVSEVSGRGDNGGIGEGGGGGGEGKGGGVGGGGLVASAIGVIQERLGHPADPTGRSGYIFSVATDPEYRRRGYSRACVTALLEWFRARGISRVELRATPDGEPLYRSLGFAESTTGDPLLSVRL